MSKSAPAKPVRPSKARRRQLAEGTVREQFRVLTEAARGCDLVIGAGALQIALRSIAETLDVPYVFAAYCPATLPSPDHPPVKMGVHYPEWLPGVVNRVLWRRDAQSWNFLFRATLNDERAKLGLRPVANVQRYVFTDRPWLAADPVLAPAPRVAGTAVVQTGAWLLRDDTPLPEDVERFITDGEPPIYLGFGSMSAPAHIGPMLVEAARRVGRRAILLKGWGNLGASDGGSDCLVVGDVNHQKLFPRVAAIVHHGGSGTTTTATRAGRPQVVVPHHYDQFYWASRITKHGVGVSAPPPERVTVEALVPALRECLRRETAQRAEALASRISPDGARHAAQRLGAEFL